MRVILLAFVAAVGVAVPAASTAAPPKTTTTTPAPTLVVKHTDAGTAAARAVLPTLVEFGPGWAGAAASSQEAALTCPAHAPALAGVVETGSAVSDTFQKGSSGPFVSASSWVYASPAQAATVWKDAVVSGLLKCFVASVKGGSSAGVKLTVRSSGPATIAQLAERAAAYSVAVTAQAGGRSIPAYYVLVLLGNGPRIAELSLARFSAPVSGALELPLVRALARRLQAGSR